MSRAFRLLTALSFSVLVPELAQAGWVIDWSTTASSQKGEKMAAQNATQEIAGNRVRMEQPEVTTIVDYTQNRYVLINTVKHYFWSGTIEDYVREMSAQRSDALRSRTDKLPITKKKVDQAKDGASSKPPSQKTPGIDISKLPPVSLTSAGQTEKIAGYDTEKYEAKIDGDLFQEIWVAPTLNLSSDLDNARFLALQKKTGSSMLGKSAKQYNALYNDAQYQDLLNKGFVLKTVTHHLSGTFERVATSVKQEQVPDSSFAVPEDYRKVRLADLFDPPPTPAPHPATPPEPRQPAKLK